MPKTDNGGYWTDESDIDAPEMEAQEDSKSKGLTPEQKRIYWEAFAQKTLRQEESFRRVFNRVFDEQKKQIVDTFEKTGQLPGLNDEDTAKKFEPIIELVYSSGFDDALPKQADLLDEHALEWIATRSLLLAKSINATTLEVLRKELQLGFSAGESIQQLTKRIEGYFTGNAKYRAEMTSRTEVIAASNEGALYRYEQAGVEKKQWLSARDERTRETHLAADGQIVGIHEDFVVGGDRMQTPGQGSDPSENINCRCTILASFD